MTQYLNFHRHTEPGGGSMCEACGGTFQGFCFCSNCQVVALNRTGGWGGLVRSRCGQKGSICCVKWASDKLLPQIPSGIKGYMKDQQPWMASSQRGPGKAVCHPLSPDNRSPSWPHAQCPVSVHLRQGCLAAAWPHVIQRFSTMLSRLLGSKWEGYVFPSSGPCNYCYLWEWIRCQSKCFPYVSFF